MGLFDAFSADENRQIAKGVATQSKQAVTNAASDANKKIDVGTRKATVPLNQSVEAFQPYNATGQALNLLYGNALGVNGPEGNAAAVGAFQNSPGFQSALDTANQNVLRNQAQTGALNSGNTLIALSDRARGLQNQEWYNWLDNLYRGSGQGLQGAAGMAQGLTSLADLFSTAGQNKAQIALGKGSNLANIYGQEGQNLANANNTANANQWNALLGLGGAAAQGLGAYYG